MTKSFWFFFTFSLILFFITIASFIYLAQTSSVNIRSELCLCQSSPGSPVSHSDCLGYPASTRQLVNQSVSSPLPCLSPSLRLQPAWSCRNTSVISTDIKFKPLGLPSPLCVFVCGYRWWSILKLSTKDCLENKPPITQRTFVFVSHVQ